MFKILIISFIAIVYNLHTHHNQLTKRYDENKYLAKLEDIQAQFKSNLDKISSQINQIQKQVNSTDSTASVKLSKLEEQIAEQRDTLYRMQKQLMLPFKLKQCQCKNFTQEERAKINQKLTKLTKQLTSLKQRLKQCTKCPLTNEIQRQITVEQSYIDSMKKTLSQQCCRKMKQFKPQTAVGLVDINASLYKDNLNGNNWYYGKLSKQQYMLEVFKRTSQYNLTSCPEKTPYAQSDFRKCTACNNGQFFNLQLRKCQSCSDFEMFDVYTKRCIKVHCQFNQIFNQTTKQCENCPKQFPFYNVTTVKCQKCAFHTAFDQTQKKCIKWECPKNQTYNIQQKKCQPCPQQTPIFNQKTLKCALCPHGQGFNTTSKKCFQCQITSPIWSGQQCEPCPGNTVWSKTKKQCFDAKCSEQTPRYNSETQKCENCPQKYLYDNILKVCRIKNTTGICPPSKPIYDPLSYSCEPCPFNSTYDKQKGTCQRQCLQSQTFNWKTGKCQNICKYPLVYHNRTCITKQQLKGCETDQIFIKEQNHCIKISSTCKQTEYYNTKQHKCLIIPTCPQFTKFNAITEICQPLHYTTSINVKNLIMTNMSYQNYAKQYSQAMKNDKNLVDCPETYPYFNKQLKKCVKCSEKHPYFNIGENYCQDCGGLSYNQKKRQCSKQEIKVSPTLQRLIMNIK